MDSKIAIIGGTDVEKLASVLRVRPVEIDTEFGPAFLHLGEGELADLAFVSRHGNGQEIAPERINHHANLKALEQLGVQRAVALFSVCSVREEVAVGDFVVLDQFLDLTPGLLTFQNGHTGPLTQADLGQPYCAPLAKALAERGKEGGLRVRESGTCACSGRARLETAAEVRMLRTLGADVVGTSAAPEAVLARELNLHYAAVAIVGRRGAGMPGPSQADPAALAAIRSRMLPAMLGALRIPEITGCTCKTPAVRF